MAHILVVDDDPSVNGLIALLLKFEGHDVRQAHDGKTALRMAHESVPDLILLDVGMPKMSGYQVACSLYESATTKRIPIIFVSAHDKNDDLDDETSMPPIIGYLRKPFEIQNLIQIVRNGLASSGDT
ncbi:MAG TPA: response regulator [Abditibacteriaceae bacterium]|jgi:DNA-binding response OmpR family regulator